MGLQQLGVEGKLESWFCTCKFSNKSILLANKAPTASSPRRCGLVVYKVSHGETYSDFESIAKVCWKSKILKY